MIYQSGFFVTLRNLYQFSSTYCQILHRTVSWNRTLLSQRCYHQKIVNRNNPARFCQLNKKSADTLYSVKCFHCLVQNKEQPNNISHLYRVCVRSFFTSSNLQKKKSTEREEDSDSEDEGDYDDDDFAQFEEDYDAPVNYKFKQITLKSVRADALLANSINTARSSMDEAFYGGKIKVNGETLLKKAKMLGAEDYVDLVVGHEEGQVKVQRVRILKISNAKTSTDKVKVFIRVWKHPFNIKKENRWTTSEKSDENEN